MKWWKYSWAVVSDLIFIVILMLVLSNITDAGTSKLMAAIAVVYLCVIGIGVQLTRQISSGFMATMLILQSVVNKNIKTAEDLELKLELDASVQKAEKDIQVRNVQMLIHGCFSILICLWMLTVLLSGS